MVNKAIAQDAHKTRQRYQIRLISVNCFHQGSIKCLAARVSPLIQYSRFQSMLFCYFQSRCIRPVTDDCGYSQREFCFNQRLHVAATPGDEDNKGFHYFSRGTRMTLPITQRSFVLHLRGALVLFRCATRSHLQISISSLQHQQVLALLSAPCRHRN